MRERARWAACVLGSCGALVLAVPAAGQEDVESLAGKCQGVVPTRAAFCREAALAAQAAHAAVGLLAGGGAQVPGGATTLGRRFGGMPRFAWSLRGNAVHADLPDVRGAGGTPFEGEGFLGFGAQGSLALGLFDGFSIVPTIGGVFSLDVLATAGLLVLPEGDGFGSDPNFWGLGVRLGLLRESFTMPGVTLEGSWRSVGDVRLGDPFEGDRVGIDLDPTVTSARLLVGKDLLALGVLAGAGWERYASDGTLREPLAPGEPCVGTCPAVSFEDLRSDRLLFFGGASLNLLLLQLSTEGGWARGFDTPSGRPEGGYDPGDSSLFFSLAARLTL